MVSLTVIVGALVVAAIVIACIAATLWLEARNLDRARVRRGHAVALRTSARSRFSRVDRVGEPPIRSRVPNRAEGERSGGAAPVALDSGGKPQ